MPQLLHKCSLRFKKLLLWVPHREVTLTRVLRLVPGKTRQQSLPRAPHCVVQTGRLL